MATSNRHKVTELTQLLTGLSWQVQSLQDYPAVAPPDEDGATFEANALHKALYYSKLLGAPCVADDSGIMVDALSGAPGVLSARYAGPGCSDADNNARLLHELNDVPESRRTARFVCCAAFAEPDGRTHVEEGIVHGRIGFAAAGDNGFGYDPLFIPEGHQITFAQFTLSQKQAISHRGRAFRKLRAFLESLP
ncbi:MAG: RdgB/HAM1 family non-canonical purine NTP pyrophosphatase [Candidatus Hydrogenedentes bacterium]|nr:RdgB/HAM1 family non-canonical purine NTP pyrophosphatase [Candidatus Hydrogenedentota bacterium]